jgi:hypothetical protein
LGSGFVGHSVSPATLKVKKDLTEFTLNGVGGSRRQRNKNTG